MAVDFLKFLSPERRQEIEKLRAAYLKDVEEAGGMDNAHLAERVEYYLSQCEFPRRWRPGEPVYDGAIAHVFLPELIKRVRAGYKRCQAFKYPGHQSWGGPLPSLKDGVQCALKSGHRGKHVPPDGDS